MTTISDRLKQDARLFVDPATREYRSTPPERQPDHVAQALGVDYPYVSGRDIAAWPGKLAAFREEWELLTPDQQDEALGVTREVYSVRVDEHGYRALIIDGDGNEVEATRAHQAATACVTSDEMPAWPDLYFLDPADAHIYASVAGSGRVVVFGDDERVAVNWRLPRLDPHAPTAYALDLVDAISYVKIGRTPGA